MSRIGRSAGRGSRQPVKEDQHWNSDTESGEATLESNTYEGAVNLPAHQTKHLDELVYRFPSIDTLFRLKQRNDTNRTGSSLWLSSQMLSSYLLHAYSKTRQQPSDGGGLARKRVLELGSGTGLLSLLMARLGWQVVATDIPPVLDSVLRLNIEAGLYTLVNSDLAAADQVHVRELEWTASPNSWDWHPPAAAASDRETSPRFDLIITADTIYQASLVRPLLSTLAHLYHRQPDTHPTILLALERRDPSHITQALRMADQDFGLPFKQIPAKRVRKIFDTLGDGATWSRDDWDGVEIWKL